MSIFAQSPRLMIRQWEETDIERLAQLANNKNVSRGLNDRFPYPYTRDDARVWVLGNSQPTTSRFALVAKDSGDDLLIGDIGFQFQDEGDRQHIVSLGYRIGEDYRGKGYTTEAVSVFVPTIFTTYPKIKKIISTVHGWNRGSARVLEKNGFVSEGILEKELLRDDKYIDVCLYAKFAPDVGDEAL